MVAADDFTIKSVLMVFSMILFSAANANAILLYVPQIASSLKTANRLLELARLPLRKSHEYDGQIEIPAGADLSIDFNNMTFAYPTRPDALALKNATFKIPSQACTAVVGQSGSGKSTIASLLLRIYYPPRCHHVYSTPNLTVSGYQISALSTSHLRNLIAVVPQTPTIFPLSVSANITYGLPLCSPHLSRKSIETAAEAAGIHSFVEALPQGYDTMLGEGGGIGLSGGQAQRIVVARALVRRPRILILDEATSALDKENAAQIRETVRRLINGEEIGDTRERTVSSPLRHHPLHLAQRFPSSHCEIRRHPPQQPSSSKLTVIIITHAKDMMTLGDKIVVMKHGECAEQGTFEELRRRKGGELWELLKAGGVN